MASNCSILEFLTRFKFSATLLFRDKDSLANSEKRETYKCKECKKQVFNYFDQLAAATFSKSVYLTYVVKRKRWRVYSSQHEVLLFLHDEYTRHNAKYRHFFMTSILVTVRSIVIYSWRVYSSQCEVFLFIHDEYTRNSAKYSYLFMTSILVTVRSIVISSWRVYSSQRQISLFLHYEYTRHGSKYYFFMTNILVTTKICHVFLPFVLPCTYKEIDFQHVE